MAWPRLCHSSLNVGTAGAPGGVGLRTGQATAVAVLQCRRSRTAEISCQSKCQVAEQRSGSERRVGQVQRDDVLVQGKAYDVRDRVPAALSRSCTVSGRMYSEGSTGWDRRTPRHRFFGKRGCKTGLTRRQWHCSFWRWQVGMEMEIAMAAGIF